MTLRSRGFVGAVSTKVFRSARRAWGIHRLGHEDELTARDIASAVRDTLTGTLSMEEQAWVERIEAVRAAMNSSSEPITKIDFGAGSGAPRRRAPKMDGSVKVTSTLGEISRRASKSPFWCRLLFQLVRTFKPSCCVEMGTAVGISTAYQAAALQLNGSGRLTTLEGDPSLSAIAEHNLGRLALQNVDVVVGRFQDTLEQVLRTRGKVDYVFVDGHHDELATLAYFETISAFLTSRAVLVFDDIAWSDGMVRAWRTLQADHRVSAAIEFGPVGVCLMTKSVLTRRYYRIPLP